MTSQHDWAAAAADELLGLREARGGWPYRRGNAGAVEPTATAALGLLTRGGGPAVDAAAEWLTTVQRPGGALGVTRAEPEPGWATPYAVWLWAATHSQPEATRKAVAWLETVKGEVIHHTDDPGGVVGHDTTLVGWPWVPHTHSWLEPTIAAVLALELTGRAEGTRVAEGLELIRDRAISVGGWNYGNRAVFGKPLRPQPGPTGMALLALSGRGPRTRSIDRGLKYLRETLPTLRASVSLGWGLLGLAAWGERPEGAAGWLAESFAAATGKADAPMKLGMLLLAASPEKALALLGRSIPADSLKEVRS